jgi:pimeloyl-ACP methyl ester carboxylesterase
LYRTPNSAPLVIFCHGNNGNISERQYMLNLAEIAKFNLVLFDYAGYGQSMGSPSLPQIELDSLAIYDRFVPLFPHSKIIIWGESLGSHAATTIAKYRKIHHLLILAGFSSFEDVARYTRDGIVGQLASLAVRSLTEVEPSVVKAKAITAPVIVIHSTEDTFIPYRCAQILYEAFAGPKQFVTVTGDHATPDLTPEILTKLCLDVGISVPTRSQLEAWLVELKKTGKYFLAQFQMGH